MDEAIGMYQRLHMWDDALNLAEAKAHPDLDQLKTQHARWLLDTGQEEKAGSLKEAEGTTVSFFPDDFVMKRTFENVSNG